MLKKISFVILINIILLIFIELSVRFVLDYLNFPKFYVILFLLTLIDFM